MTATIIAVYSNKGGVGKTTTAVNLAYLAAHSERPTLVCDLDAQAASTFYFRVKPGIEKEARGLKYSPSGEAIARSIKGSDYDHLDLLPADLSHRNLDVIFSEKKHATERLQRVLHPLRAEYDFIFLDCPPTLNLVAENIFNAADRVLIPLIPTTLAVHAYAQTLAFMQKKGYDTSIVYSFFSMVDTRKKMHRELATAVYQQYNHILQTPIPALSLVEQMGVHRQPVPAFAPHSPAAQAYRDLWAEFQQKALA